MFVASNQKGIALILTVVLAVIFLSLAITVGILVTSSYKTTSFYKNRTIALMLAETGVADALYSMSYRCYSSGDYSSFISGGGYPTDGASISSAEPFGSGNGSYSVTFYNPAAGLDVDYIESVGTYKNKQRTIRVYIRGNNTDTDLDSTANGVNGIAEAFNKHVIYALTLGDIQATITGNMLYVNDTGTVAINMSNATATQVAVADFDPAPILALDTASSTWGITDPGGGYSDFTDWSDATPDPADYPVDITVGTITASYDGLDSLVGCTDTYTFTGQTINADIRVAGNVVIDSASTVSAYVKTDDDNDNDADITCSDPTLSSGAVLWTLDGGNISLTYDGANIDCDFDANGTLTLTDSNTGTADTITGNLLGGAIFLNGNVIAGSVVSDGNITLQTAASTITPANNDGALLSNGGDITLGDFAHDINGLVYASGNITINNGDIDGCIVSQGTLTIPGSSTDIDYYSTNFQTYPNATYNRVYSNFTGGRRIYLPAIDTSGGYYRRTEQ